MEEGEPYLSAECSLAYKQHHVSSSKSESTAANKTESGRSQKERAAIATRKLAKEKCKNGTHDLEYTIDQKTHNFETGPPS